MKNNNNIRENFLFNVKLFEELEYIKLFDRLESCQIFL